MQFVHQLKIVSNTNTNTNSFQIETIKMAYCILIKTISENKIYIQGNFFLL